MSLRARTRPGQGIIEPCLPSAAERPPSGPGWLHEIKHDGFRIMARRDGAGIRLITRHGNDFTNRFPIIIAAVTALPARSFLIDGEAVVTNGDGLCSTFVTSVTATLRCLSHSRLKRQRQTFLRLTNLLSY
jgi:bifunctional non-homologous end joining protein LigD